MNHKQNEQKKPFRFTKTIILTNDTLNADFTLWQQNPLFIWSICINISVFNINIFRSRRNAPSLLFNGQIERNVNKRIYYLIFNASKCFNNRSCHIDVVHEKQFTTRKINKPKEVFTWWNVHICTLKAVSYSILASTSSPI